MNPSKMTNFALICRFHVESGRAAESREWRSNRSIITKSIDVLVNIAFSVCVLARPEREAVGRPPGNTNRAVANGPRQPGVSRRSGAIRKPTRYPGRRFQCRGNASHEHSPDIWKFCKRNGFWLQPCARLVGADRHLAGLPPSLDGRPLDPRGGAGPDKSRESAGHGPNA